MIEKIKKFVINFVVSLAIVGFILWLIGSLCWKFFSPLYNAGWNNINEDVFNVALKNVFFSWQFLI